MCDMDRLAEWKAWVTGGRKGPAPSLSGIDRRHANLHGADLQAADLRNANLRYANLHHTNLRGANLRGADLHSAKPCCADLRGADLHGADLRDADLRGVDLRDASLRRASLYSADLPSADLRGVDLYGVDLRYANLRGAELDGMLNAKELIVNDPRGHRLVAVKHDDGWHVFAGCRRFVTLAEAIDHWSSPDYPNLDRGQRYAQALTDFAKEM